MIGLNELTTIVDKFESDHKSDCERVYKSCREKYIVVMEKLHDTQTNENRADVVNKNTAKFRASKLNVLLIINLLDGTTDKTNIVSIFWGVDKQRTTRYTVGSIVEPNYYDQNIDVVCSNGIHYFRSLEPAYFYGMWTHFYGVSSIPMSMSKYTGVYKQWHDNGAQGVQCTIVDGKWNGLCEKWFKDGQMQITYYANNKIKDGFESCHDSGEHIIKNA